MLSLGDEGREMERRKSQDKRDDDTQIGVDAGEERKKQNNEEMTAEMREQGKKKKEIAQTPE